MAHIQSCCCWARLAASDLSLQVPRWSRTACHLVEAVPGLRGTRQHRRAANILPGNINRIAALRVPRGHARRPSPSPSALFTAMTSASSRMPRLIPLQLIPAPGQRQVAGRCRPFRDSDLVLPDADGLNDERRQPAASG